MTTFAELPEIEKDRRIEAAYTALFADTEESNGNEEYLLSEALQIICTNKETITKAALLLLSLKGDCND